MNMPFLFIYIPLLSSARFKRSDGANAGKEEALTEAGGGTQLRGESLHDFKPHKILAQQPGECSKFQL